MSGVNMQNIREKILRFFLLVAVVFSLVSIARAETTGGFLGELLSPSTQANNPSPSAPAVFSADKSAYTLSDSIKITNAKSGSAVEIYWLDNPETAGNSDPESRPSNIYAILVNDDGTVNIDATTLLPGNYVLVNTFEPGYCGGFYLAQCRARSDYLGEVSLSINP